MNEEKTQTLRILVVDDEEAICRLVLKYLSIDGYEAEAATSGKTAVRMVGEEFFNIVFLDIVMPGISGIEVLERIKEISPKTEVIMMTGSLMNSELRKEQKKKGASGFLLKPFKIEEIVKIIRKFE